MYIFFNLVGRYLS